ncbi:MAG TPA: TetR family transcriptional regulator [Ktedonobacterales bacterium]|nr:TetR family transcriptional regulator [Ktedonobacterales bacterium]
MAEPGGKVKRRYNSVTRREQASGTRRHIMAAAGRLFAERGFARTTMESIAAAAEIGVATVYVNFATKAAIVEALVVQVTSDPQLDVNSVLEEGDLDVALRRAAANIRQLHERSAWLTDLLRSSRGDDPVLEVLWRRGRQQHLRAMREFARELKRRGVLVDGMRVDEAADILYALAGAETYRELVVERGWAPRRYQAWLEKAGRRLLLTSSAV